jgi:ABC-type antimicrobial peptide transport system permease subunit
MQRNYLKMAIRYLLKNKVHSFINIAGLSVGMTIAILIGLWIRDEYTYDRFPEHYDKIGQVYRHLSFDGEIRSAKPIPTPLPDALKESYGSYFKYMALSSWTWQHILSTGDKKLLQSGNYIEPSIMEMLSMKMLQGNRNALAEPASIILSATAAKSLFGTADPMGKLVKMDNDQDVKVTGIYADFPYNSEFRDLAFIAPFDLYINDPKQNNPDRKIDWGNNSYQLYVQLADNADFNTVNTKIRNTIIDQHDSHINVYKPTVFIHPMSRWHLFQKFENGVNVGGRIQYVWLFGIIGIFVLLLACINFMNLSTAKSEKRAKEVGIRKSIGSLRHQLIAQFLTESLFITLIAYVLSVILVIFLLPAFNYVADKQIILPWKDPLFWLAGLTFAAFTGMIAGSYPAFFLSSFQPVKVLKGSYKAGKFASLPRRVLVVLQFTVSITLIIGTITVFRQIEYGRNRPVGYDKDGLVSVTLHTAEIPDHFSAFRQDLKAAGLISEVALSSSTTTGLNNNTSAVSWEGKDPNLAVDFGNVGVTFEYGQTVGWQFLAGRDFNAALVSDSNAIVLNESAAKYMGMKDAAGKIFRLGGSPYTVIGVIKNMVMEGPYEVVRPTFFYIRDKFRDDYVNIRIKPGSSPVAAIQLIESVCRRYDPESPVHYKFTDAEYASKFEAEMRIGKLAGIFAILAVFISCLGLFGMASFMAEQRTKELGIRKILGASLFNLWGLLSKEFVMLVVLSVIIATPLAILGMRDWLNKYTYHTEMPWWVFVAAGTGALLITILTVSYQGIRAALMNPVKSLRTE